jgi:hypothetical protein
MQEQGGLWKCRDEKRVLFGGDLVPCFAGRGEASLQKKRESKGAFDESRVGESSSYARSWRLKSRVTLLKEGDQNMSFSHCLANSHLMNNFCPVLALMEWTLPIKR